MEKENDLTSTKDNFLHNIVDNSEMTNHSLAAEGQQSIANPSKGKEVQEKGLLKLKKELQDNPNNTQSWISYLDMLITLDHINEAEALIGELIIKGAKGHALNELRKRVDQSKKKAAKSMSSNPKPEASSHAGLSVKDALREVRKFARAENYSEAIEICQEILLQYPHNKKAKDFLKSFSADHQPKSKSKLSQAVSFNNLASKLKKSGDSEAAMKNYKKAIEINPNFAQAHYNLGVLMQSKDDYIGALNSYDQALKIEPNLYDAQNNKSVVLRLEGRLHDSVDSAKKAIKLKPDHAGSYTNLGLALQDMGELDNAIDSLIQALKLDPNYHKAYVALEYFEVQNPEWFKTIQIQEIKLSKKVSMKLLNHPMHQIYKAISTFMNSDFDEAIKYLQKYIALENSGEVQRLDKKNQIFSSAYNIFLSALIKKRVAHLKFNQEKIYHLGESHCLSYAHSEIHFRGEIRVITPRITFGAKAYHFSQVEENAYKTITFRNLSTIPKESSVFISFGEIDCRYHEGFLLAAAKKRKELEPLVQEVVSDYVEWFQRKNLAWNHTYFFFTVPAPIYDESLTRDSNLKVGSCVEIFNRELERKINESSMNLIDVYSYTKDDRGLSNGKYHCDSRHLDRRILPIIDNQLNSMI